MTDGAMRSPAGPPVLEFRADRTSDVMIACGFAIFAFTLFLSASYGRDFGGFITAAIPLIILGVWTRTRIYLKFDTDYFEVKLALAAGWHAILYSEVTSWTLTDKLVVVSYRTHGSPAYEAPKKINISLGELRKENVARCIETFHARLPPDRSI